MKIILTGATGMVGEGVLLECLAHPGVEQVLSVSRRTCGRRHPKLHECIVPDFMHLESITDQLRGYDACLYCAGISSVGMSEADYSHITVDTALHFARALLRINPSLVFGHVSGAHTSDQSRIMWTRVKARAEQALLRLPFRQLYHFRPGFMKPAEGQRNVKGLYRVVSRLYPLLRALFPGEAGTIGQLGRAMINSISKGYPKQILEVADIRALAAA